jgi:hypothetical protein
MKLLIITGRTYPAFMGTPRKCYEDYILFCKTEKPSHSKEEVIQSERIFHRERMKNRIGIQQGYVK